MFYTLTWLATASGSHRCLLYPSWCCPLYRTDYRRWESSLLVVPQLMMSTLQYWVLQVGVIIACCATVDDVRSTVLSTAGGSHHCLLCHSCPFSKAQVQCQCEADYFRVGGVTSQYTVMLLRPGFYRFYEWDFCSAGQSVLLGPQNGYPSFSLPEQYLCTILISPVHITYLSISSCLDFSSPVHLVNSTSHHEVSCYSVLSVSYSLIVFVQLKIHILCAEWQHTVHANT
jgi:hypothetical protein